MHVRLLHDLGNDHAGEIVAKDDRRAQRLIQMGYAEPADPPVKPRKSRRLKNGEESATPAAN